ncbi:nucleotidyltransferase [Spirochaetia bacterium]|nr:nucleotidyltransferase [Spirochaetia bacterium]
MSKPVIVVLAAGMGSRYGGLKQMDKIGSNGEVLLDYSVFDAKRAGFGKAVFIIRRDIEKDFRELVLARIGGNFPCELAFQEMGSLIPADTLAKSKAVNRTKPWGTTHALLCAKDKIDAPFTVINADDFYGREAFDAMGKYLSGEVTEGAIVPYRLEKTLSPQGTVTRGVCEVSGDYLSSVDELTAIAREGDGKIYNTGVDGSKSYLPDTTPVSMNFWGFPAAIFGNLKQYFDEFLASSADKPKAECYLPMAADWFIKNKLLKIRVLEADAPWFGVTYKEDREAAVKRVADYTAAGVYPQALWK